MKMIRNFLILTVALIVTGFTYLHKQENISNDIRLVASTPAGMEIRTMLNLGFKDSIDFIRWNIILDTSAQQYQLELLYGMAKPNTTGFIHPATKIIEGKFVAISGTYILKSPSLHTDLKFIKISKDLYHLLDNDGNLLVGNGGWSYVLNNTSSGMQLSEPERLENQIQLFGQQEAVLTFDGRTPCDQIPNDFNLNVSGDCIKLKWRLKLQRGSDSGNEGTYTLRGTFSNHKEISGKYSIVKDSKQQDLSILHLFPSDNVEGMQFLIADKNILYFLNPERKLFVGDSSFSYALNRIND